MPVYEAFCKKCGKVQDYIRRAENYLDTPECCGEKTQKVILTPPMGYCENIHYQSPITGQPITTKQQRIEDLRRNNCRPWEGMEQETKVAQQRKSEEEKKLDAKLTETASQVYASMTPEKRRSLEAA